MYSSAFCKVYNEFGWNYFPEAFAQQLLEWIRQEHLTVKSCLDLGCGTGVLCEILHEQGIRCAGMDLSEGMIAIARERNSAIRYEVADMVTYRPQESFDLVTCTGDALNHIASPEDVAQIFRNVYGYLNEGGFFVFDLLNEKEIPSEDPIDLPFSETVTAQFRITRDSDGRIHLRTATYENGTLQFEEDIIEVLHDIDLICRMLAESGFREIRRSHQLPEQSAGEATTWYVTARK